MTIRVVDLFCGTGAITYGLEAASKDFVTIGGIDLDSAACKTASLNHGNAKFVCGSILDIGPDEFGAKIGATDEIDVIVGGPPCQGFSSLRPGRASRLEDPRNNLYEQFARYVEFYAPRVFMMENVVGMINQGGGALLIEILNRFRSLGYNVDWRILNAANYGVPQKRERFILIGCRSAKRIQFPVPTHRFKGRVIGTRIKEHYIQNELTGAPAITVDEAISDLPEIGSGQFAEKYTDEPTTSYQRWARLRAKSDLSMHIAANHNKKMLDIIRVAGTSKNHLPGDKQLSGFSSCYSRLSGDEPATTVTVKFTSPASSRCIHPWQDRAITPREAARLQGYDDSFIFAGTKSQIASQIGNAVPPLLGMALAPSILELL